jgi:hypothetical protein
MLKIDTSGSILIDGRDTGLKLIQRRVGSVIYTLEGISRAYVEHKMPYARYSTTHDAPASGVAGRADFERDLKALIESRPAVIVDFDMSGHARQCFDQEFETEEDAEQYLASWIKERSNDDFYPVRGDFAIRRKFSA